METGTGKKTLRLLVDAGAILLGSLLYAAAFDVFLSPNNIAPGGVTGISMIINQLIPVLPIGALIIVINLPLFVMGWKSEGQEFLLKSLAGTVLSSVFIDIFAGKYTYTEDPLMSAIYGGVLMGAGLGVILMRGGTTGGSDIAGRLLLNKFPHMSYGRMIFGVDLVIIASAALVFRHISYALYAIIMLFVSSRVIDAILYGTETGKAVYIITSRTGDMVEAIYDKLSRGVTLLSATGAYSGAERQVILCAIKRKQIAILKELVRDIDPESFVIVTEANEVLGEGFQNHHKK